MTALENENKALKETVDYLTKKIYGRKSETSEALGIQGQMSLFDEAETEADPKAKEPTLMEVEAYQRRKKFKGQREEKLKNLPHEKMMMRMHPDDKFCDECGNEMKLIGEEFVRTEVEYIPAKLRVIDYYREVYECRECRKNGLPYIEKIPTPNPVIPHSYASPSSIVYIMHQKFENAVPLYRLEKEWETLGLKLSRATMANWTIKMSELYLKAYYDQIKNEMMHEKILNVDETPFTVTKDGRDAGSKSYMWVYRSSNDKDIVLYDYQPTRKAEHPQRFLNDYAGIIVSDGYAVYHKLAQEHPERFKVAGCWAHLNSIFATSIKSVGKEVAKGSVAQEASLKISRLYHMDNKGKDMTIEERKKYRQNTIKPIVDEFFEWAKEKMPKVPVNSETGKGLKYAINQEVYLKVFLTDPIIPLDNNAAERSIRPFCLRKKNWVMIDTMQGAEASAIIYSIVETAKANNLKIYHYLKYLLEELPKHINTFKNVIPEKLFPWSDDFPEELRKATDK